MATPSRASPRRPPQLARELALAAGLYIQRALAAAAATLRRWPTAVGLASKRVGSGGVGDALSRAFSRTLISTPPFPPLAAVGINTGASGRSRPTGLLRRRRDAETRAQGLKARRRATGERRAIA
ncbi:hypothetical protein MTO96_000047 [Rhipicephalus appendiculatus]